MADLACRSSSEADVVAWAESHERGWKELAYWDSEQSSDKAGNEGKTWVSLMGKAAGLLDTAAGTADAVLDVALIHAGKCPVGYVEACDWAVEETGAGSLSIKAPVVLCVLYGELPTCGASYFLGPKGGRCPAGTEVTSEAECRAAQRVLGLTAKKAWSGADAQVIEGCSWLPSLRGGHDLLWNEVQFESGSTSDVLTPLCSRHGVSDVRLRASDRRRPASAGEEEKSHPQGYRGVGHWDVTNAGSWAEQGTTFGHGLMELYVSKKACVENAQART